MCRKKSLIIGQVVSVSIKRHIKMFIKRLIKFWKDNIDVKHCSRKITLILENCA